MPIFEYTCNQCGKAFEELVFGSAQEITCPACKATDVTKQLSVFAASNGGGTSSGPACGNRSGCGSGGFS